MSELEILKNRIKESGPEGVETSIVRDDYEPAGDLMIKQLVCSGDFLTRKTPMHSWNAKWRIFSAEMVPY